MLHTEALVEALGGKKVFKRRIVNVDQLRETVKAGLPYASLEAFGPWFYRRVYWETGVIGQILYLEAEASGIRSTGMGCFFDDLTHRVFGLTGDRFQVLYHFTMGGPVDDPRLQTHPPYQHLGR